MIRTHFARTKSLTALLWSVSTIMVIAAACGTESEPAPVAVVSSSQPPQPAPVPAPEPAVETAPEPTAETAPAVPTVKEAAPATSDLPSLFSEVLTDVLTAQTFTISDHLGSVVVMETMAVWCPLCTRQQTELEKAFTKVGNDVVFLSVDVDPNENKSILRKHAERQGWQWSFVAPSAKFARELSDLTSRFILDPTLTPVIIIDKMGSLHLLRKGIKSADELVDEINKYNS